MKIGTIFLGKINEIEGEYITTKFFIIGLPLIPVNSFYATSEKLNGINGFEIPICSKSVALGYARTILCFVGLMYGLWAYFEKEYDLYLFAGIALFLWVMCMFFIGNLSQDEKLKRTILRSHSGLYADPALLSNDMRCSIYESLEIDWKTLAEEKQKPWLLTKTPWEHCLMPSSLELEHYTLAYTMTRYAKNKEAAEKLWALVSVKLNQNFQTISQA
jgi:hypothetical protein